MPNCTIISDSEVLNAMAVLLAYSEQVMEHRSKLYWEASGAGDQTSAEQHLKRYRAASGIHEKVPALQQLYRDSK